MTRKVITETARLIIAEIDKNDAELLLQLNSNRQVMRFFPKILNYNENYRMIEKILDQYKKYGYSFWKLLLRKGEVFVGIAGLLHQEIDGNVETEISYRIMPEYWNCGFASEAAQACKDHAEKKLRKKRLISLIHPENVASKCVAEKLGAKQTALTTFLGIDHEIYVY
jgi:RimJ/RimL family protein N-acetyltransferase